MSFRPALPGDVPRIEALLLRNLETSVFLLSNLRRFGPEGADDQFAMRYWVTGDPIAGVIAQSTGQIVMAQWPGAGDWRDALVVIPKPIKGVIGHGDQMNALLRAAGLRDKPTSLDADEVLMSLELENVVAQPGLGQLRPLREADRAAVLPWRTDYEINTLGASPEEGAAQADRDITNYIAADSHRLLVDDNDTPLSMTGFNATVDDLVQIGGVYTPPDLRGQGLARRAVALHLKEARNTGAARAILFANDPSAIAAYAAVGFEPIGRFVLIMFKEGHSPQ